MDRFQNTQQPDWDWWGRLWPTPGETLRELGISTGTSLAEVGSGNGYFALPAARITDPAPVYAVDIDESLLDEFLELADKQALDNTVSVHCDARLLVDHFPETVDVAFVANTFHGIDDPGAFVDQILAVLDAEGSFVVVNWLDRPRETTTIGGQPRGPPTDLRLSPDETRSIVEADTPLSLSRQIDLPPYHYGLVFER